MDNQEIKLDVNSKYINEYLMYLIRSVEIKAQCQGHSIDVALTSMGIADLLGLDQEDVFSTFVAGYYHDIGKYKIPEDILIKNGKLTDIEFEIIKSHTYKGAEKLHLCLGSTTLSNIVRFHHERMDGKGYERIVGDNIPISSRIIAVADYFHANLSKRPYKESQSIDYTFLDMLSRKGHFDRDILGKFIANYNEIIGGCSTKELLEFIPYPKTPLSELKYKII